MAYGVVLFPNEPISCIVEAVIFCGIQAAGKTTFYKENFFKTHVRISLDLLRTRNREDQFLRLCLATKQPLVVDNTNPTRAERDKYIQLAKANQFKVIGYYFQSKVQEAIARNDLRQGKERIPEAGIKGTFNKLAIPKLAEGFDQLFYIELTPNGFIIKDWTDEI